MPKLKTVVLARLSAVAGALMDYVMLALIAMIGAMAWVGFVLWRKPDEYQTWENLPVLIALSVGMVGLWVWLEVGRRWRPLWRGLAMAGLAGVGVVSVMWLSAWKDELSSGGGAELVAALVQGTAFLLVLVALFVGRRLGLKKSWWTWRLRAGLAVCVGVCVVYLKNDAPESPSVSRNREALAGGYDDEASYRLTVRYWSSPNGGGATYVAPSRKLIFPGEGTGRTEYLVAHRAEILANWEELAEVRAWWTEMAALPALGDLTLARLDQPLIKFAPVRAYMDHALAIAELRALDGDGDGALTMVSEVYKVGAHLESPASTLVRGMIAVLVQRNALKSATFVLDHATVSAEARGELAGLLAGVGERGPVIRTLLLCEALYSEPMIKGMSEMAWTAQPSTNREKLMFVVGAGVRWLAFNPQDTINRIQDELEQNALLAQARDLEALRRRDDGMRREQLGGFRIKNLSGRMMVSMVTPAFRSIAKSYWEKEDARQALQARLAVMGG